jgi:hypothetical protein
VLGGEVVVDEQRGSFHAPRLVLAVEAALAVRELLVDRRNVSLLLSAIAGKGAAHHGSTGNRQDSCRQGTASLSTNRRRTARVRDFHGEAAEVTPASLADSFALVAAVDRYPDWCPDAVRAVDLLARGADGYPSSVWMRMHIARGASVRDFNLYLAVGVEPLTAVKLTRFTDHPTNQEFHATWLLRHADSTRIELQLDAKLRVPPYIPAGGIPDAIAEGFVSAACRALAARQPDAQRAAQPD